MKRKRGKKSKSKRAPVVGAKEAVPNIVNLSTEENSGQGDIDEEEINSIMEAETPSSTGTDLPEKPSSVSPSRVVDKTAGKLVYNRVKVKIKTSKMLESQLTSSDAHTQSDTDKSCQHVGLSKQGLVGDGIEDSANSVPGSNVGVPVDQSKKAGGIKIKSSKGFSSSLSPCNSAGVVQSEKTPHKEPELLRRDSQDNKQELNAAMEVIKKTMKMDAAEPFNVPVNPVALGIPDYFDVIDTPMDFGTICGNLENGVKYMKSEDVFRDVECIWENCYKYNNKGDYVLELMKRVKKNFTKYWTAAGLYSEQPQGTNAIERNHAKDANSSCHGKIPVKGGQSKHKTRKRHGVKRHKDSCLCAICVMMRRRQEREESAHDFDRQMEINDGLVVQEVKPEGTSPVESPRGDDTSSMDNSLDPDADADLEDIGGEVKLEENNLDSQLQGKQEDLGDEMPFETKGECEISEPSQLGDRSGQEHNNDNEIQMVESGDDIPNDSSKDEMSMQHDDETAAVQQQKPKDTSEKAKIYENLRRRFENPIFLELCGTLFAENPKSIWGGPHSLVQHSKGSARSSSIHAAITTFMK